MPETVIFEVSEAGVAAVLAVPHVVRFTAGGGLVAAAQILITYWAGNHTCGPSRLVAFFGVMYFAGLHPDEAISLRKVNVAHHLGVWNKETRQWERAGLVRRLAGRWRRVDRRRQSPRDTPAQDPGTRRQLDGTRPSRANQRSANPHREFRDGTGRTIVHWDSRWRAADHHLPAGLDQGTANGPHPRVTSVTTRPAAIRPPARIACRRGVPATQVAECAGHSVDVLLRIYAKCLVGQDELAKRRISEALRESEDNSHETAENKRQPATE